MTYKERFQEWKKEKDIRVSEWKSGKQVYENGRAIPHLRYGTDGDEEVSDNTRVVNTRVNVADRGKVGPNLFELMQAKHNAEQLNPAPQGVTASKQWQDYSRQKYETQQWAQQKKAAEEATDEFMLGLLDPRYAAAGFAVGQAMKGFGSLLNAGKNLYKSYKVSKAIDRAVDATDLNLTKPVLNSTKVDGTWFDHSGVSREVTGNDINGAVIRGMKSRHEKQFEIPDEVKTIFNEEVIPRRLAQYELEQPTSGVKKIRDYTSTFGNVDFSTKEGLQIANDQGWTMDEVYDYMDYMYHKSQFENVLNTKYYTYPKEIWDLEHPVDSKGIQTVGTYDPNVDRIELPEDFNVDELVHELRHRMQHLVPLSRREKNILANAYPGIKENERESVNTTLRHRILDKNNYSKYSLRTQNSLLGSNTQISNGDIFASLVRDSYGDQQYDHMKQILDGLEQSASRAGYTGEDLLFETKKYKNTLYDNIREALKIVGGLSPAFVLSKPLFTNDKR